jgi:Group II intron, maturase-specific domain
VSSLAYNRLDAHVWRLTWKWARHTHPDKPRHWVVSRYFGMFNPSRNDRWLFGSRDTGHYLRRFSTGPKLYKLTSKYRPLIPVLRELIFRPDTPLDQDVKDMIAVQFDDAEDRFAAIAG